MFRNIVSLCGCVFYMVLFNLVNYVFLLLWRSIWSLLFYSYVKWSAVWKTGPWHKTWASLNVCYFDSKCPSEFSVLYIKPNVFWQLVCTKLHVVLLQKSVILVFTCVNSANQRVFRLLKWCSSRTYLSLCVCCPSFRDHIVPSSSRIRYPMNNWRSAANTQWWRAVSQKTTLTSNVTRWHNL
jgi:hypothetical protein